MAGPKRSSPSAAGEPEMTLPEPGVGPPMRLPWGPTLTSATWAGVTPPGAKVAPATTAELGGLAAGAMAAFPRAVVPTRLFCTALIWRTTRFSRFPEMVLAFWPGTPIRVPVPFTTFSPRPLGRAVVPRASVPIKFPTTVSLVAGVVVFPTWMPTALAEIWLFGPIVSPDPIRATP